MAKTAAERQKPYPTSTQFAGDNGERRESAYVRTRAALALHRLSNSYGITKRKLLEKLLIDEEEENVLQGLNLHSAEGKKYLGELS